MADPIMCHLQVDPPADGGWNMAVDEVLLTEVITTGVPVLRFYEWSPATLSLGYFQSAADRALHPASEKANVVRRLSGGGAILHDRELTYSLILPASHPLARDTQQLYNVVHQTIIDELESLIDLPSSKWHPALCHPENTLSAHEEPFLCFQRRAIGDILMRKTGGGESTASHKIVGSAQRRRQATVLQHGSILLGMSTYAPELLGIAEITQTVISAPELTKLLRRSLANNLELQFVERPLTDALAAKAEQLRQNKYEATTWTNRR